MSIHSYPGDYRSYSRTSQYVRESPLVLVTVRFSLESTESDQLSMDMVCGPYMVNPQMRKISNTISLFRLPYTVETTNERLNTIRSKTSRKF